MIENLTRIHAREDAQIAAEKLEEEAYRMVELISSLKISGPMESRGKLFTEDQRWRLAMQELAHDYDAPTPLTMLLPEIRKIVKRIGMVSSRWSYLDSLETWAIHWEENGGNSIKWSR